MKNEEWRMKREGRMKDEESAPSLIVNCKLWIVHCKFLRTAMRYLRISGEYPFINEKLIAENLTLLLRKIILEYLLTLTAQLKLWGKREEGRGKREESLRSLIVNWKLWIVNYKWHKRNKT